MLNSKTPIIIRQHLKALISPGSKQARERLMVKIVSAQYRACSEVSYTMKSTHSPLPRFSRAENPPGIRFQLRDEDILEAIYGYGGVLAKRQLKEMFWPDKSWRAMEKRLSKLYHNGYLNWPNQEQWRRGSVPQTLCGLEVRSGPPLGSRPGLAIQTHGKHQEKQIRKPE